ncbi:uncharacterized protein LOC111629156 [Centruroides sculpturatus]|uniref:uncharacterized protein LOC111629155 n=1 Tax=Centruroides sculpturatus TaxID=218467 RepID=UPI000C6E9871|nr:uncharacterized protein LOC111629155 [Centruroides sculpturatus]XP_023228793.1 uncharacterized protein LOC111629156 [Centruroides sculpturatus]
MNKGGVIAFVFCLMLVAVIGSSEEDKEKYPKGRYCAHKNSAAVRKCVRDHGFSIVGEIAGKCAKQVVPDLDLEDGQSRRDYFCEEAEDEVRKSYKSCFREKLSELDNIEELRDVFRECIKVE